LTLFTKDVNPKTNKPYTYHKYYLNLEDMADAIPYWENNPKFVATYHACASYLKPFIEVEKDGETRKKYRVEENWDRAKSFWIDIDCGQKKHDAGQGYLTKADGVVAIATFAKRIGLPRPMIVDSGNGIHAYWPLTKDISHTKWVMVAKWLKSCLAHESVLADSSRTADFASILRPVGSANRKGDAKDVKVKATCEPIEPGAFALALQTFVADNNVKLIKESAKKTYNADLNSDLTVHLHTYPNVPIDLNEIANKCAQVAAMRDTSGGVPYEHWRGVAGLAKFSEGGEELMHQWSEGHPDYSYAETQAKIDTWNADPTSCAHFEAQNSAGCVGCEHKGKLKGPIVLGRVIPIVEESTAEIVTDEGVVEEAAVPALPYGYIWDGKLLSRLLPDKEGVLQPLSFCENLFYPTSRIRSEDGTFKYGIRFHLPDKRIRDFDILGESVASSTDLLRALARYELTKSNHKNAGDHMSAYLLDQLQALKRRITETNTLTAFGWRDEHKAFLLGDKLYIKGAEPSEVLIGGNARERASTFTSNKGSLEGYAEALNFLYNREGAVHWQYTICAGWGSLLAHHCEDLYKGLILALQGGDTARGKTTVCHAALAAFGNPAKLTLNSKDGFTTNALWATLGVFNNIPVLVDELTGIDPATFSDVAYGVSNGQDKIRMTSKGGNVVFAKSSEWRLNVYITGNKDFHGLLAANQANSQAEAVRLIQVNIDRYQPLVLTDRAEYPTGKDGDDAWNAASAIVAAEHIKQMTQNSGHAGAAIIKYMLENEALVAKAMEDMLTRFTKLLPSPKYRFYRAHSACTMVVAQIAKKLGIIQFDLQELYAFTGTLITELADSVMETNAISSDDAFSRMISHLNPRIVVTSEYRDKRDGRGPETPRNRVFGDVAGRFVLGTLNHKEHAGHLMLSQKEVRDWCMKNRIDFHAMLSSLQQEGALLKQGEKFTLTRGTDYPVIQQRCIFVDTNKLDKDAVAPALTLVSNQFDGEAVGEV
jgi:hypothetical protein